VWLDGSKLSGCYVLNQIKLNGDQRHWLLVKSKTRTRTPIEPSRTRPATASASRATDG